MFFSTATSISGDCGESRLWQAGWATPRRNGLSSGGIWVCYFPLFVSY